MKKIIAILFLLCCNTIFAQSIPDFKKVKIEKVADYKKVETIVLQASAYILSTPYDVKDIIREDAWDLVRRWMAGTPDYTFVVDQQPSAKLAGENIPVVAIYLASMAKYCLENPASASDQKLVRLNTFKMVLAYCDNASNNIKMTKHLTKLSEANKNGKLQEVLDSYIK